jgi:hypothetical protein
MKTEKPVIHIMWNGANSYDFASELHRSKRYDTIISGNEYILFAPMDTFRSFEVQEIQEEEFNSLKPGKFRTIIGGKFYATL